MPVPPPRRKVSKEGAATPNNASRLPRIVGSTIKTTETEPANKKTFTRNNSVRRTFTKEQSPSGVKETLPTRLSEPVIRKQVPNGSSIQRYPSTSKPVQQSEYLRAKLAVKTVERETIDRVVQKSSSFSADISSQAAEEVNATSSTNTSSLNLSNLQPSLCSSFDSQPNSSHDSSAKFGTRDSPAQSKVPPKRNKLPAPKIQRTSSINGTVSTARAAQTSSNERPLSEQQKVGEQSAVKPVRQSLISRTPLAGTVETRQSASLTENSTTVVKPSRPSLTRRSSSTEKVTTGGQKVVRSISSDQAVEEVKPATKQTCSESNLVEKTRAVVPPRTARSISKIPTSKLSSTSVGSPVKPLSTRDGLSGSVVDPEVNAKKPPHSVSKRPSFSKKISPSTSKNSTLTRTPSQASAAADDVAAHGTVAGGKPLEPTANKPEVLKPPRSSRHLKDRVSLIPSKVTGVNEPQSDCRRGVANLCQADKESSAATSEETQEAANCDLSAAHAQEASNREADDTAEKSSFIGSRTKQLIVSNDSLQLNANSSVTSSITVAQRRESTREDAPTDEDGEKMTLGHQLAPKYFLEPDSRQELPLDKGGKEKGVTPSVISSQVGSSASTPLGSPSSIALKKAELTLDNSIFQLNNEEQDLNNYGSGNESNFLFLRRRKLSQLPYEENSNSKANIEPSPSFSKRSSGQVAKKANRVRDVIKNDVSQSDHQKSNLKPELVTSGILGGSSTQGEIPLLRCSVLPASVYPEKIPIVLNHGDDGCQSSNSCPVEKTLGSNKRSSDCDSFLVKMSSADLVNIKDAGIRRRPKELRREKSLADKPPIPKPARPSLLRRASSSSALLVKSRETTEKPIVNSEILIVQEDRTVVQIMTGAPVKQTGSIADLRSLESYQTITRDNNNAKEKLNTDTDEEKFHDSLCATIDFKTVGSSEDAELANEQSKLNSVTNSAVAEKTDHPQIVSRIPLPTECELEDILVRTELTKKESIDTVANDAGFDSQFCPSSDVELYEMLPPGYSKCEFNPAAFMQNMITPQKGKQRSVHSVRSLECSPSRSSSPAKSVREYETAYANIKRRNSELSYENSSEIVYSNTRASSEYSRTSSPMGYNPGVRYDPHRRVYVQDPFPFLLPPAAPKIAPIEHDTVYATIRPKAKPNDIYDVPRSYQDVGMYGTCRSTRSETYAAYKEHPQRVGFIQPLNPRDLFYSSDSPSVHEVSMQSGLNPSHLTDSCDYAEFLCSEKSACEYTGSEFTTTRMQDHTLVRRGHGLKARIFRKMSSIAKSKTESPVGTFYKKKTGETPDYATVPGPGHRKLNHSVSRELLSKMEAERESIKGGAIPMQEFDSFPEDDRPELPEAVRYERFNPPVLSSRFSRVDLVEDPAFQSAVVVIGGEKKVVPLHRESADGLAKQGVVKSQNRSSSSHRPGNPIEPTDTSPLISWRKNDVFRSHSTDAPEGHSGKPPTREQRVSEAGSTDGNAITLASDDSEMGRNKSFRSQSAWDLRRPWSQASSHRPDGDQLIRKSSLICESPIEGSRSSSPAPSTGSEGVLQKFRKSFSLRFHRRVAKPNETALPVADNPQTDNVQEEEETDSTFRFGPITWRASKERKRTKKAASNRNSKCNSGDSGIQVTRPPSVDFECLGFVNEFPSTVTTGSPDDNPRVPSTRSYPLGGSATAPQSPAEASNPLWMGECSNGGGEGSCFGSGRLRRAVSQPLQNGEENEPRRPSPEGCEVDFGVGYSSEDELENDDPVTQRYNERALDPALEEIIEAVALYDLEAEGPKELSFRAGDVILVEKRTYNDWWLGTCNGVRGWLPASFVKVRSSQEANEHDRTNLQQSAAQLRSNVVNEILQTERDYVKHLTDIVEGYMTQMRQRPDMFTPDQIVKIFGNIGPLFEFQKRFLRDLEASYNQERPEETCVGSCFLRHISSFEVYSDYCTQHGGAVVELQNLYENERSQLFLESCRLLRGMADIKLGDFLHTPVQRICKYPLHLGELLKNTGENHSDYADVNQALHSMKEVVTLINERKRKLEEIERLSEWQKLVENWQGDDLTLKSSELIYGGDLQKISHGGWAKDVTMYLFDRQAILCKKDLIKRNSLTYKARFSTEGCESFPVPDGKDSQFNTTVKFAFKVRDPSDRWYFFTCKTVKDRDKWLSAFARDRLLQQGEGLRSLPDGASFDSIRRLESKAPKLANERQRLRHIKSRPRVKKIDPESVLSLQEVTAEGSTIRVDTSRKNSWFSIGSSRTKKRFGANRTSEM